jgi:hypothetical protein
MQGQQLDHSRVQLFHGGGVSKCRRFPARDDTRTTASALRVGSFARFAEANHLTSVAGSSDMNS